VLETVIFYEGPQGERPVQEFMDELKRQNPKAWAKCISYMKRLVVPGPPFGRNLAIKVQGSARLWELRPEWGNVEYRFLFAQVPGRRYLILHGAVKHGASLPDEVFARAERRLTEWEGRSGR
jgi:hypothetical protein